MVIIIFFIILWYTSLFSQTFFLHRYAAHRMFTMNKFWERFFFVFTFITQGSSYLSPRVYGALHRMHHAFADTENDPHSPKYDGNIFKMMAKTRRIYLDILRGKMDIEEKYTQNLPTWKWFDAMGNHPIVRVLWVGAYTTFFYFFVTAPWQWALLPLCIIMGPLHGAIINWFAHTLGYRNFKVLDTSVNMMPWDIFMMGEGLHNNHHKRGTSMNFAYKWWEFDPSYPIILLLRGLRIIKPHPTIAERTY